LFALEFGHLKFWDVHRFLHQTAKQMFHPATLLGSEVSARAAVLARLVHARNKISRGAPGPRAAPRKDAAVAFVKLLKWRNWLEQRRRPRDLRGCARPLARFDPKGAARLDKVLRCGTQRPEHAPPWAFLLAAMQGKTCALCGDVGAKCIRGGDNVCGPCRGPRKGVRQDGLMRKFRLRQEDLAGVPAWRRRVGGASDTGRMRLQFVCGDAAEALALDKWGGDLKRLHRATLRAAKKRRRRRRTAAAQDGQSGGGCAEMDETADADLDADIARASESARTRSASS